MKNMKVVSFFVGLVVTMLSLHYLLGNGQDGMKFYRVLSLKEYEGETYCPDDYYETEKMLNDRKMKFYKSVVSKEKTATNVAKALYLSRHSGEEDLIRKIYAGSMANGIWKISVVGSDSVVVYIQKNDGRILRYLKYDK